MLLLEAMLAFADKDARIGEIFPALRPGGRFAYLEEGPGRHVRIAWPDEGRVRKLALVAERAR